MMCKDNISEKKLRAMKFTIAIGLLNLPPTPTREKILNGLLESDERLKRQVAIYTNRVN